MPSSLLPAFNAAIPYQALFLGARIAFHLFSNPNPIRVSTPEFLPTKTDYVHVDPTHTVLPSHVPWFYTALAVGLCFVAAVVGGWLCVHRTTSQTKRPWSSVRAIAAASMVLQAFRTILVEVGLVDVATVFLLALGFAVKNQLSRLLQPPIPWLLPAVATGLCFAVAVIGGCLCILSRLKWRAGKRGQQPRWCLWAIAATIAVLRAFPVEAKLPNVETLLHRAFEHGGRGQLWFQPFVARSAAYILEHGPSFIQSIAILAIAHLAWIDLTLLIRRESPRVPQVLATLFEGFAFQLVVGTILPMVVGSLVAPAYGQVYWAYYRYSTIVGHLGPPTVVQLNAALHAAVHRTTLILSPFTAFQIACALPAILHACCLSPLIFRLRRPIRRFIADVFEFYTVLPRQTIAYSVQFGALQGLILLILVLMMMDYSDPLVTKLLNAPPSLTCYLAIWAILDGEATQFRRQQYEDLSLVKQTLARACGTFGAFWRSFNLIEQLGIVIPVLAFYTYWDIVPFYRRARITYRIVRRKLRRRWRI